MNDPEVKENIDGNADVAAHMNEGMASSDPNDAATPQSDDCEEGITHVSNDNYINNYIKNTQVTYPVKESCFKVQPHCFSLATHLELHVKTLYQDDQGQGHTSVAGSTLPSLRWPLHSDFGTST